MDGKIQVEINVRLFYTFLAVWLILLAAQLGQEYKWMPTHIPVPLLALFHQITGMLLTVFTGFVGLLKMGNGTNQPKGEIPNDEKASTLLPPGP